MADEQTEDYIKKLEEDLGVLRSKNSEVTNALAGSSYASNQSNLIEFQLDPGDMLSRIEHFLRGDYISVDQEGNEVWTKQTDSNLILFNEYGVNSIMIVIGNYIDKNTMLSTYDDMRINEILGDLGDAIAKFIYYNYEKMGMDTEFKKTRYEVIVLMIIHNIESTYRRAIRGDTRIDLNSAKIFTQSDLIGGGRSSQVPIQNKGGGFWKNLFKI